LVVLFSSYPHLYLPFEPKSGTLSPLLIHVAKSWFIFNVPDAGLNPIRSVPGVGRKSLPFSFHFPSLQSFILLVSNPISDHPAVNFRLYEFKKGSFSFRPQIRVTAVRDPSLFRAIRLFPLLKSLRSCPKKRARQRLFPFYSSEFLT